jgi:hypothetical protein
MHPEDIFAAVAVITIGSIFISWVVFQAGRLNGYRSGVEDGAKRALQAQHLRGMTDGYVMALQHTPGQRAEYMNNVLLRMGAISEADIEADRQRRMARQAEMEAG